MNQQSQPTTREQRALVRALERRFGQSSMPYAFHFVGQNLAEGAFWRVTDVETGSYLQGVFLYGRLQVRRFHDGAAKAQEAA